MARASDGILTPSDAWSDAPPKARTLFVAAVTTFGDRGYHGTTTRDIAALAGMSPAGLYVHFASKERLLYEICRFGHGRVLEIMRRADDLDDPIERLATMARDLSVFHAEHHTLARVNQNEFRALSPALRDEVIRVRQSIVELQRDAVRLGVRDSVFRVDDVVGTSVAILTMCLDVARWFPTATMNDAHEVGELYAGLALRMVGAGGA